MLNDDCLPQSFKEELGFKTIGMSEVRKAALDAGLSIRGAELSLLQKGIMPRRYIRTAKMLGTEGLIKLLSSSVALVGCGGVGGFACEIAARLGVGRLILIDGDSFDESNLNRQLYAEEANLGQNKALAAAQRVSRINSGTDVVCHEEFLTEENAGKLLDGAQIVIDAMDCLKSRFVLESYCNIHNIPFVFGGIGDSVVQISSVYPSSGLLSSLFDENRENNEDNGSPAPTVALCGSLLAAEMLKIICEEGKPLYGSILQLDWLYNSAHSLEIISGDYCSYCSPTKT